MKLSTQVFACVFACIAFFGCAQSDVETPATPATMFFNITSGPETPHPVTMALQLAGHSLDDGREVVLFFNLQGVLVPTNQLPDTLAFGDRPIKEMLTDLISRGASVHVCPHCMSALGVEATDLLAEAQVTNRELLFARLTGNTIVFTY